MDGPSLHRPKRRFFRNVNNIKRAFPCKFLNEQNNTKNVLYNCYYEIMKIIYSPFTVHTISSISVLMVIASSFSVRHICFYEWEPYHCAEDSRRRSYDVTSVSQMETSDDHSSRRFFIVYCTAAISLLSRWVLENLFGISCLFLGDFCFQGKDKSFHIFTGSLRALTFQFCCGSFTIKLSRKAITFVHLVCVLSFII